MVCNHFSTFLSYVLKPISGREYTTCYNYYFNIIRSYESYTKIPIMTAMVKALSPSPLNVQVVKV